MSEALALIAGLGNPGQQYQHNRHNAGAMFLDALCRHMGASLKPEAKFHGLAGRCVIAGYEIRLLFPTTYMNKSGQALAALAQYYKIKPQQILVAYDELDLPLGVTRLKSGGGHGGHNGIRDIISALGDADFQRLRIGIGHPGESAKVLGHVLGDFTRAERSVIDEEIEKILKLLPLLAEGKLQTAMHQLHTKP
ncbi:MAG: aminoacyl-tRNA hydrolase [Pseudomonadales bacterium]|jgi:PTH1 family peptidyl-tRNA hydrolase|nr:aminoacyl-tRNA hydrolase [Pseudomonadales bacterium]